MKIKYTGLTIDTIWENKKGIWTIIGGIVLFANLLGCTNQTPPSLPNNQKSERSVFKIRLKSMAECKERDLTTKPSSKLVVNEFRTSESILETVMANRRSLECIGGIPIEDYTGEIHIEYRINPDGSTSEFTIGKNELRSPKMQEKILEAIREWRFEKTNQNGTDLVKTDYVFE